jgi:hypothetical protein
MFRLTGERETDDVSPKVLPGAADGLAKCNRVSFTPWDKTLSFPENLFYH